MLELLEFELFLAFQDEVLHPWTTPEQERHNKKNDENDEQDVSDPRRLARYSAKAKYFGNDGDNQKKECPT